MGQAGSETLRQRFEREMNDPELRRKYFDFLTNRTVIESDPRPPEVPAYLRFERGWQTGPKCGPVALYFLLRLKGIDASMDRVIGAVPLGEAGASLADLKKAADRFGLPTRTVAFTPEDMSNLPTPYIVHYNLSGSDDSKGNHFDVIFKSFGNQRCNFLDTTNCVVRSGDYGAMSGRVSGYALITGTRHEWWLPILWAAFVGVLAGDAIMLGRVAMGSLGRGSTATRRVGGRRRDEAPASP